MEVPLLLGPSWNQHYSYCLKRNGKEQVNHGQEVKLKMASQLILPKK
jgi:hypothetical protein